MEAPSAARIYQGETIAGQFWTTVTDDLAGEFRVHYDDGSDEIFTIDRTTPTNTNRGRNALNTKQVAKHDGFVVGGGVYSVGFSAGGFLTNGTDNRGKTYVMVGILSSPAGTSLLFPTFRAMLGRGYVYLGGPVVFGSNVEPGPTSGAGAIRSLVGGSTLVNGSTGISTLVASAAAGQLIRVVGGEINITCSATVGTRSFRLRFRDSAGNVYLRSAFLGLTATQTGTFNFAPNLTTEGAVQIAGTASVEMPSPDRPLHLGGDLLLVETNNIDAAGDVFTQASLIEEWTIPGMA